MEYEIFVWNAVLVINLHWVLLFHFSLLWSIELSSLRLTTVIMQNTTCIDLCKCDDNLIDRKSFWTLDFNWETFMQPTWAKYLGQRRKELFPVTLNNSSFFYWNRLILVSEIKKANKNSGEMLAHQQFSSLPDAMLILYHLQYMEDEETFSR